jgi:hypothetical protein
MKNQTNGIIFGIAVAIIIAFSGTMAFADSVNLSSPNYTSTVATNFTAANVTNATNMTSNASSNPTSDITFNVSLNTSESNYTANTTILTNTSTMANESLVNTTTDNQTCNAVYDLIQPVLATEPIPFDYFPNDSITATYEKAKNINGMTVEKGSLRNDGNESVKIITKAFGKTLQATILPGENWTFARIRGMVIASDSSQLRIDLNRISYYEMNQWLKFGIEGDCKENNLLVYTDAAPTRLSSTVSAQWKYDYNQRLLTIFLKSCSSHEIVVDWSYYPLGRRLIYVEDFTRSEDMAGQISLFQRNLDDLKSKVTGFALTLSGLEKDSKSLLDSINNSVTEKNSIAFMLDNTTSEIKDLNQTSQSMEKKINENTLLTPIQTLLIATIMLALLLYIALFGMEAMGAGKKAVKTDEAN